MNALEEVGQRLRMKALAEEVWEALQGASHEGQLEFWAALRDQALETQRTGIEENEYGLRRRYEGRSLRAIESYQRVNPHEYITTQSTFVAADRGYEDTIRWQERLENRT